MSLSSEFNNLSSGMPHVAIYAALHHQDIKNQAFLMFFSEK